MKAKTSGPIFILQTYEDRLRNLKNTSNNTNVQTDELSQKLNERLIDLQNDTVDRPTSNKRNVGNNGFTPPPPPLPPQENGNASISSPSTPSSSTPSTRSNTLKNTKTKPKAPPVPIKYSVLSRQQPQTSPPEPPPCPSPDYDTLSLASTTSSSIILTKMPPPSHQKINDSAEMDSLESFKINNPLNVWPRPPNTFFQKRNLTGTLSNQSSTSTIRRSRPLSVTIGEYPTLRRQPGKLEFLQNGHANDGVDGDNLGSRLTSELTQTLNRSNLKKRTESMANPV